LPSVERDGCRISWESVGHGTPVLLIMGAAYSSRMWHPTVPALSRQHQVITFDNRGTGKSTATRVASIGDMADDALAVLDAAGVDTAHVYGASLGGVIAIELALRAPDRVRSLVLGCTGILSADKPRAPKVLNAMLWLLPRRVMKSATRYGPACPPERKAANQAVLRDDVAKRRALIAQQNALRAHRVEPAMVAKLDMAALVLHGTDDPIVPPAWGQELADTLPNGRLVTYNGAGHNYVAEMGDQPNADVLTFLGVVDAEAAEPDRSA
jgi:pimeloyl-ACP methyl ester carboxylesterase